MSDLISTPSQAQSPVSNDAFEALIDLLASDGTDELPSKLAGDHHRPQPNVSLRDPSGKLDFDKIRLMFAAQNKIGREKNRVSASHEDGESDEDHQSASSVVPSRSHSMSPNPVARPSAGHRRSSTFGNQPWAAMHENAEDAAPTLSRQSLSFDDVSAALVSAREEVRSLRQQYDVLQALISKRFGTGVGSLSPSGVNGEKVSPVKQNGHAETPTASSEVQPSAIVPLVPPLRFSDVPAEIANLTEEQAKSALSALACSLNLSLDAISSMAGPSPTASPGPSPNPMRPHDIASITLALKFLGTVDELVWRRTSAPSGPRTLLPVFSEENVFALVARLELWERAVRRSTRS